MNRFLKALVGLYQKALSPYIGGRCRYVPTCSEYMKDALEAHGSGKGLCMGIRRLLRCHPFGGGGFDPVKDSSR